MLREKFITIQAYLKIQKIHQIYNLTLHLKQLEEPKNTKISRRKEIAKIRAEINEMKETIAKINKTIRLLEKINKIDNPLARLIK